jgi:hypothetical protein
MGELH